MCTVTYTPQSKGFVLTSNRDENSLRSTTAPQKYQFGGTTLCYPKDSLSNGSWIAMSNKGRVVCLLNGAFISHEKKEFHTNSRGTVLLESAKVNTDPFQLFSNDSLANTEPFTLLTIDFNDHEITCFSELIWDGNDKHYRTLDPNEFYIWSSVTLYSNENRKERKVWFKKFLNANCHNPSAADLIQFHSKEHSVDSSVNLIMEREGNLKTVSTTQIVHDGMTLKMNYFDLIEQTNYLIEL
ncbi:MAG: NRDE family protein [Prolixibacteraceae bacterium]